MTESDIVLVGLKRRVAALSRETGQLLWSTELPAGLNGSDFVSLSCDNVRVFAYTHGELHCLDLCTGTLHWTNQLKGFGFGIASVHVPGSSHQDLAALNAALSALAKQKAAGS